MDKSWMNLTDRLLSPAYAEGVNTFLTMARNHSRGSNRIRCPCRSCCNNLFLPIFDVETHLFIKGINPNYTQWIFHGEEETRSFNDDDDNSVADYADENIDDMDHMLDDIQAGTFVDVPRDYSSPLPTGGSIPNASPSSSFDQLLEDARRPLFSGLTDATAPTVPGANQEQPKRRCGLAKCTEFEKLRKHGKVLLKINDGETAPCCENASMFTTRVMQIVRQYCDMSYARWTNVPQAQKDKLIDRVRGDFVLDWDLENHRLTVLKQLRKRFNAFHHELHKKYLSYGSHEEALASRSSMVDPVVWVKLCGRWGSDNFKKISRQNRENRKRLTINHTAGRKSFVRILEEKRASNANLVEFYKETHWSKKNGKFVTSATEDTYKEMVGKLDDLEPEQHTDEAAASVVREVLGHRPGYARGLGEMVIPESTRQRDCEQEKEYHALIEKHKKDADNYKTQLDEMRDEMRVIRERQNETNKMLKTFFDNFRSFTESLKARGETQ